MVARACTKIFSGRLPKTATAAALVVLVGLAGSRAARADVEHTIAKGHTLEAIANRYHVTVKAIMDANHLKDAKHLRVGEVLTIPGVKSKDKEKTDASAKAKTADGSRSASKSGDDRTKKAGAHDDRNAKGEKVAAAGKPAGRETTTFAMKAKTPGVVHVRRFGASDDVDIRVNDARGRVPDAALKTFEKVMRSPAGMAHPIEQRLVALLGTVSNHFGSRKIELVSGFRPFTPGQYNPHSNHMHGRAIDFRIAGVPNEAVRDFCRTLKNVGCGYYPNSVFVHMDVRDQSAFWIDYSKPGEPPRYNAPNVDADEGTSDVQEEAHGTSNSNGSNEAPSETTTEPSTEPATPTPGQTAP